MRFRWSFISVAAAALVALLLAVYREIEPQRHTNVIVLTVESARAEVMAPDVMPNVWRIAKEGVRFTDHRAVSGWTGANIISLLTGLSPFAHGIHSRDQHIPADWPVPLKDLARGGWRVAGLQPFMQIQGFQDLGLAIEPGADLFGWLARQARSERPFVLWYHYLDTHLPYAPPPPFRPDWAALLPAGDAAARARVEKVMTMPAIPADAVAFQASDRAAVRALYLGDFRAFDAWFAEFWRFLERSGLRENTLVVLTADHGDELLERGHVGHASTARAGNLHEEIVHIPLVLWLPAATANPPAGVVDAPSSHLDIMPTIFAALGQEPTRRFGGSNLLASPPARPWSAVTSGAGFDEPDPFAIPRFDFAALDEPWKLELARDHGVETDVELYNLTDDPGEIHNLATAEPGTVTRLRERLLPQILAMRLPARPVVAANAVAGTPRWVFPAGSGAYRYGDLAGRFRLEWTGAANGTYRVQYEAGSGLLRLNGEFDVEGTVRDFGTIDRPYWNKWVVPYGAFRLRVGVAGRDDEWSPWIELQALP